MEIIEHNQSDLSTRTVCGLLGIHRSRIYYKKKPLPDSDVLLISEICKMYESYPFFGYRKIHAILQERGITINRKKVQKMMKLAGLQALYPKKKTTITHAEHKKYPYLLKNLTIKGINHVWGTDITYVRVNRGYIYLVCLLDY